MNKKYLLGKILQATLFAVLAIFSTGRKTVMHFVLFLAGFFVLSIAMDIVFGKILDRKIKKELEKLEEEE